MSAKPILSHQKAAKSDLKTFNGETAMFLIPCTVMCSDGQIISIRPNGSTQMARIYEWPDGELSFVSDHTKLDPYGNPR